MTAISGQPLNENQLLNEKNNKGFDFAKMSLVLLKLLHVSIEML
jgi:hypothetical protein